MPTLRLYHAWLRVHGIVFFSSRVYPAGGIGGTVEETAPYIHNYPLIYALSGLPAESYAVTPSRHYAVLGGRGSAPLRYPLVEKVLEGLVAGDLSEGLVYAYPAAPRRVVARKFFMAAKGHGYAEFRGRLKTGFPRTVHLVGLGPGSELEAFVVASSPLPRRLYARIGMKRMGALLVELDEAWVAGPAGEDVSSHPVNLGDLRAWGLEPRDWVVVLETRSIPMGCPDCARVGYARTKLYRVEWMDHVTKRRRAAFIPLPPALAASAAGGSSSGSGGGVEPAW